MGRQVKAKTVADALSAIAKTFQLAGKSSPIHQAHETYTTPVARLMEGYRRQDPPPVPQLAVPLSVPELLVKLGTTSLNPHTQAVGDLANIAFYYLLRVGEYTKPRTITHNGITKSATRTKQFKVSDIGFFKDGKKLPRTSNIDKLLQADACTLKITNQKNGRMGQTIHHEANKLLTCPVKACARRVHHIISHGGSTDNYICDVKISQKSTKWTQITPQDMLQALRKAVKALELHKGGLDPDLIGVHSLRAGGAMALKLHGANDTTIMKAGRWTSLTFLEYIHNQIAHLSKDLSKQMGTHINFINIAAIE